MKTKHYFRYFLVLAIMLCLLGALCLSAGAEDMPVMKISGVPVQAAVGDTVAHGEATVPKNVNYRVFWDWYRYIDGDNSGEYEPYEGVLKEGECYFLEFTVWVNDQWKGWESADEAGDVLAVLEINGGEDLCFATVLPVTDDTYAGHGVGYFDDYDFTKKLETVALKGISEVVAGGKAKADTIVPAGKKPKYTVSEARWSVYNAETGLYSALPEDTFVDGGIYQLFVRVQAAEGYGFSDETVVTLNGEETDAFHTYSTTIEIYQDYDLSKKIKEVHIAGITAPVPGEAATTEGITVEESSLCTLSAQWYTADLESADMTAFTGSFADGGYYYLEITLDAAKGYSFDDEAVAYIDDQEQLCIPDNTQLSVSVYYDLRGGIQKIELTGTDQVQIGKKATNDGLVVPKDALYTADAYWLEMTMDATDAEPFKGTFEEGHIYSYCVELYPTEGNRFTEKTVVYYNGEKLAEDVCLVLEDMIFLTPILYTGDLQPLDTIVLDVPITPDQKPEDIAITAPAGAQYTVGEVVFADNETLEEVTAFEGGKSYLMTAEILPAEGYYFAETVAFTVNNAIGFATSGYVCAYGFAEVTCAEPIEETTEAPTEETTEAPTEEPTETPTEEPTETPTEETTVEPTEVTTEEPTQAPTQEVTEPSTEAPTEPATEVPAETAGNTSDPEPPITPPTGDHTMVLLFVVLSIVSAAALIVLHQKKVNET